MLLIVATPIARGQFLRLGPFDFDAVTGVELIYTTNVEQERPSESTEEREDYYGVWSFDLRSTADFNPRTKVQIDTGVAIEKHVNRPDLDNSERPFGRVNARFDTDFTPLMLYGAYRFERTSESTDDVFVPGGGRRREVGTTRDWILGLDIVFRYLRAGISYGFVEDRFDDVRLAFAETDEATLTYYAELIPSRYFSVFYKMERRKTDFINVPDGEGDWLETEELKLRININELFELWPRPQITYSIGIEREEEQLDENAESRGWELTHTLRVFDDYDASPTLRWGYFFQYEYKQNRASDEVAFQYGIKVTHEISPRATHSFSASREPIRTLGSTQDTDETKYNYTLSLRDVVFPEVSMGVAIGYSISDPVQGPTEKIWDYAFRLGHARALNSRLTRRLTYTFTREDSNLQDELLDVHEVSLAFIYSF
ncbi:MAG TPA: hypothetical protein PKE55_00935 [Kiritimatiellia bacterium]|nr:hypothetical protein [Kiritimatiellia bacterium]